MSEHLPPYLSGGGTRRKLTQKRRREPSRLYTVRPSPRFRRRWLLVPLIGIAALVAIVVGSRGSGHSGGPHNAGAADSLAQKVAPPRSLGDAAAGGGDASRFAVSLSGADLVRLRYTR